MLRLGLVDYFDSIIREIDFYNESRAHKNEAEAKKFNERRDEQISFLRSSQAAYLLKIDSLNLESKLDESQDILRLVLDQTFFTFKYKEFMFVIQLNRYLDPRSLRWFKSVLRWNEHTYSSNKMSSVVDCEDIGDLKVSLNITHIELLKLDSLFSRFFITKLASMLNVKRPGSRW